MQLLPRQSPKWVSMIATFFLLAIFTLEEASQALIKGRDASISDLAANCAGIVTFTLLAYLTGKKVKDTLPAKSEE